jgi:hypothetical protein
LVRISAKRPETGSKNVLKNFLKNFVEKKGQFFGELAPRRDTPG